MEFVSEIVNLSSEIVTLIVALLFLKKHSIIMGHAIPSGV